jgi:hypothetical protein
VTPDFVQSAVSNLTGKSPARRGPCLPAGRKGHNIKCYYCALCYLPPALTVLDRVLHSAFPAYRRQAQSELRIWNDQLFYGSPVNSVDLTLHNPLLLRGLPSFYDVDNRHTMW